MAVDGTPSSSDSRRIFFMATLNGKHQNNRNPDDKFSIKITPFFWVKAVLELSLNLIHLSLVKAEKTLISLLCDKFCVHLVKTNNEKINDC